MGGDDRGEGADVDEVHEADSPVGDVQAFHGSLGGPVGDRAEGRLQVEVGNMGGQALVEAVFVEAGHYREELACAHAAGEASLHWAEGGLCIPGVVDPFIQVHRQELERGLEQGDGPEVLQVGALGRVFLEGVKPAALPAGGDDAVFQGVVD